MLGSSKTPDAVPPPFRGEVHPEAAVGVADVLEQGDPIGAELPAHVREGIRHLGKRGRGARHAGIDRRHGGQDEPCETSIPCYRRPRGPLKEPPRYPCLLLFLSMADYKQVLHERLYVRVPGTDKLRKTAAAA